MNPREPQQSPAADLSRAAPIRIQLSRKKGWRIPANSVKVSRPSKWGNPFKIGETYPRGPMHLGRTLTVRDARHAVRLFRRWLFHQKRAEGLVPELRGKNLACWCQLNQPCHADVLLELAND